MSTIIFKIIVCSSIFIAVYYLFLEKEKMYRFNRFYLLSSLVLSYVIPFITITIEAPETKAETNPPLIIEEAAQQINFIQPVQESFNWMNILWAVYILITLFLLIKSILALLKINRTKGEKRIYQNYNMVLTKDDVSPFSFWNTIYLGESYIKNGTVDPRIFLHEKSHLDQKHSIDLIITELFRIFTWFNPIVFLYKKAIISNHEFLADESVLNGKINIKEYQNLILDEILSHQNPSLTHSFNFNNTKKRFIMMKAKKSKFSFLKKTTGIAALIAAAAIFSERTYAESRIIETVSDNPVKSFSEATDQDSYKEFKDILSKYSALLSQGKYAEFSQKVSESDKKRLEELYPQLTDAQRNEQKIIFFAAPEFKRRTLTEKEMQSFLNKNNYAVWIDSKKVNNSVLKNYKTSDFSNVNISKVGLNARTEKNPQPYQVSLMTHSYFDQVKKERPSTVMGFKKEMPKPVTDTISPRKTAPESNEGKNTNINTAENKDYTEAQYPEGLKGLRAQIGKRMDVSSLGDFKGSTITAMAYVHIDEAGKVTQVTTSGDNETFNKEFLKTMTAISDETTWKPAIKDGKAIASVLKVPATMTFTRP
ncbi:M56 family metallopeptidase [Chryseobacterium arthrosphaerae]|uniref:M56 family metallopeptidase n=1 Tax=Chryseobacterium arthrosphaerae TaxID=651561 RepID=UPI0031D7A4F7